MSNPPSSTRSTLERYLEDPGRRARLFRVIFWAKVYTVVAITIGAVFFFLHAGGII